MLYDNPGPHYQWPHVDEGLEQAVLRQLHRSLSDQDADGVIGEFERAFADFIGTPFAVSFSSGTAALHAMTRAAGLHPGDAVLAPAYTFLATATPFAYEGIDVIFCDADAYGNVTADDMATRLTPAVRAVLVTHMWGNPCAMDDIAAFCRDHGLLLLEDCSHAHFGWWNGRRLGTFGDMAAFSTGQKAISTGEGGVLIGRHDRHRELALLFAHYNRRSTAEISPDAEYYPFAYTGMGIKYRMTTLGAAVGVHQLRKAGEIEARRRAVLARFMGRLAGNPVVQPIVVPAELGRHGLYVVGLRYAPQAATVSRDQFVALCRAEGASALDVAPGTRDLSREPLFARRDRNAPWRLSHSTPSGGGQLAGVRNFLDAFIRAPIWGYRGDDEVVDGYLAVLDKVSESVAR